VRNNLANVELGADLRITGTNQQLGLLGRVDVLRGRVEERDNVYEVRRARVDFTEPRAIRPELDVVAVTTLRGRRLQQAARDRQLNFDDDDEEMVCDVVVRVTGTLEELHTSFSTDGPDAACLSLGEVELRNWITLGVPADVTADPGSLNMAVASLGKVLWGVSGIEREIQRILPGEVRLKPTYGYVGKSPTPVPGVEFRWAPLPDLTLSLNSSLDQRYSDQRLGLEWRFGRVYSLLAELENDSESQVADFGLDLRLRWED
jgi:hypothetical protein